MEFNLNETMLQKVKIRQGIALENTQNDALIKLMLEDAKQAVTTYCHRKVFPEELEFVVRDMVCRVMDRDNADQVASVKRGDTQINYNTAISQEDISDLNKSIVNGYRIVKMM